LQGQISGLCSSWCASGPQVLFYQAAFQLIGSQLVLVPGVILAQVQDFAFPLVELFEVPASQFLQPVKLPLYGSTAAHKQPAQSMWHNQCGTSMNFLIIQYKTTICHKLLGKAVIKISIQEMGQEDK